MELRDVYAFEAVRMAAFLGGHPAIRTAEDGTYWYGTAAARLRALPPRGAGPLRLPQTELTITGGDGDGAALNRLIRLRFLSSGG